MKTPANVKFAESHEWVRLEGDVAYVGISHHAQETLGDIVYVEMPEVDGDINKGDEAANIESVKAAAPVYCPVSGTVVEVNAKLEDSPEAINENAYENFIFAVKVSDQSELDGLMDASAYDEFVENEE